MNLSRWESDKQLQTLREEIERMRSDRNRSKQQQQVYYETDMHWRSLMPLCVRNQDAEESKSRQSDAMREVGNKKPPCIF